MVLWLCLLFNLTDMLRAEESTSNLLSNANFTWDDYANTGTGGWYCLGIKTSPCTLTRNTDAREEGFSVKVSDRVTNWNGLAQYVNLLGGQRYKFTIFVKLLNTANNQNYQAVELVLYCLHDTGPTETNYYAIVGRTVLVRPGEWYQVGGVRLLGEGLHHCQIYLQTEAPAEYLADDASCTEIPDDPDWKTKANARIEEYRKATITIRLNGTYDESTILEIELQQTNMEFRFGSKVSASKIVDTFNYLEYQDAFYENFEWGSLAYALEWSETQREEDTERYDVAVDAMKAMIAHGIKMRCSSTFWDIEEGLPDWVKLLRGEELTNAMEQRIDSVINHTVGMCEEWDVIRAMAHGGIVEENTGDPDDAAPMFIRMQQLDGKARLCLSDYDLINGDPDVTMAMKDIAGKYISEGVPIGCIGAQGQMYGSDWTDPVLVMARLDILAEINVPIIITDFTLMEEDEDKKASMLSDMFTLFFSYPTVMGVILSNFWDGDGIGDPINALFHGATFTPNAAGIVYQELFHNTWRTFISARIAGNDVYTNRGFKGDYIMHVKYNGMILKTTSFTLNDEGSDIQIYVDGIMDGVPNVTNVTVI